ncbi:hypothetical protein LVD15_03940 [Fulvivirga maritima]|uniref:hypothetical protein n=1 Tax=Fulvivirga maritima TaxID=2904247 RepID=UPI001F1BFD8D|nr:hypothetical protein [Fulvivirga maritima]UII27587.1 hypothetical protein LVD15_03940 [Fulvivirga maritima]
MNRIKRYFVYERDSWEKIRKKGLRNYLLSVGLFKSGIIGGVICLLFFYLNHISFNISKFTFDEFFYGYVVWQPICWIIGLFLSLLSWIEHNKKFD